MAMAAESKTLTLPPPERSASGFAFPYATPYSNQLELMAALFDAIEHRKVAVMESPTGTGKSLSVICAALTWHRSDARRAQLGGDDGGSSRLKSQAGGGGGDAEPDWVTAHAEAKQRQDLLRHEAELNQRIERIRRRQQELLAQAKQQQDRAGGSRPRKRIRLDGEVSSDAENEDDARFLPSDLSDSEDGPSFKKKSRKAARFRVLPYTDRITSDTGAANEDDNMHLTPAVRALIAELAASRPRSSRSGEDEEDEEPESTPKIFFASRTHSQLSQFVQELRKTAFSGNKDSNGVQLKWTDLHEEHHPLRAVPLGSRKQLCIHPGVQKLGARRGGEAMNEKCLELMKGGKNKKKDAEPGTSNKGRCQFLPSNDALGHAQMLDFRDHALASVHDIEDLAELGRELQICPYYGARTAARQAELVTLPYPLLLSRASRQALALSLKDAVIIVDEAHNLIDTVLSSHSVVLTLFHLRAAKAGLDVYLARFASRLKGQNETAVRRVRAVVGALEEWCDKEAAAAADKDKEAAKKDRVMTSNEFITLVGGTFDQVNFLTLQTYLQESQLLRKVISYIDVQAERAAAKAAKAAAAAASTSASSRKSSVSKTGNVKRSQEQQQQQQKESDKDDRTASMASMMSGMYAIEAFLLSLTNRNDDGRVFVSLSDVPAPHAARPGGTGAVEAKQGRKTVTLRYQLLNPSDSFAEVVAEARSVVLLGGTMEPMSDFRTQLFPTIPPERFTTFSCGHIIPPSNLHAVVLPTAPRSNRALEFKWDARADHALLDDLGTVLLNLCAVVPGGVVVFLPSYGFLDAVWSRWEKSGLLGRLGAKKKIFQEPKSTSDVEVVFEKYAAAITQAMSEGPKKSNDSCTGALMFAVVGAKLSEGINFSDDLARAVIMVGMPFANAASPELVERMRYVRELAKTSTVQDKTSKLDAGNELYLNMCMKAVNQSIGRAIRHKNDYAALILLDRRYSRTDIRNRLPGWIRKEVKTVEQFGPAMAGLGAFFRGKRQQHQQQQPS
ncbi:ATP-dependent DNA helicase chl1 [Tilletia horrida]|uniref:ATP-dependent DNA helicase CHL1 n=1 Tax=Tilletia horrida TaxID=155126 RepID=A0AAN6JIJ6_9BASI|nr:ATP-dependent DNA helicase chl1 [Tilletia horrida]